jgi:hypothetical protein
MFNNIALCRFRSRLEYYEQSCAVDSLTKKCAGPPSECRKAMLGILGTELRSNCACKGTDFTQLYDCLGWQRLLWVNPCVGQYCSLIAPQFQLQTLQTIKYQADWLFEISHGFS